MSIMHKRTSLGSIIEPRRAYNINIMDSRSGSWGLASSIHPSVRLTQPPLPHRYEVRNIWHAVPQNVTSSCTPDLDIPRIIYQDTLQMRMVGHFLCEIKDFLLAGST